ncbi:MAG: glycogen/starch synthase [Ignavibacteria bacterium]|nr:glycogen/starch synthase [Ignavibacteria bacterium]MBI3766480.1 glycogen/starch synthase [Ignavibacteriales bacterium]
MSKSIAILFVASEAEPFIKTGSIGDLAGNLPKTLKAMGHDIRVMLPGYGSISNRRFQIHNLLRMKDIEVPVARDLERANVKSSYLNSENQKVLVYFLANDRYFNRQGLYFHPETKKYFTDNDERFIFFCRGVLETLKRLQWQPQIIHCNDWQCGLIPAYLKSIYKDDPYFRNMKTVFTVFSLASHASFPKSSFEKTGLPLGFFRENGSQMERLNFLKAGLAYADVITTFGSKAEKGIVTSPEDETERILHARRSAIVSMSHQNGNGQARIAQQLVDIYRDLAKNN